MNHHFDSTRLHSVGLFYSTAFFQYILERFAQQLTGELRYRSSFEQAAIIKKKKTTFPAMLCASEAFLGSLQFRCWLPNREVRRHSTWHAGCACSHVQALIAYNRNSQLDCLRQNIRFHRRKKKVFLFNVNCPVIVDERDGPDTHGFRIDRFDLVRSRFALSRCSLNFFKTTSCHFCCCCLSFSATGRTSEQKKKKERKKQINPVFHNFDSSCIVDDSLDVSLFRMWKRSRRKKMKDNKRMILFACFWTKQGANDECSNPVFFSMLTFMFSSPFISSLLRVPINLEKRSFLIDNSGKKRVLWKSSMVRFLI